MTETAADRENQLVGRLKELETLDLDSPTLPGDPRGQQFQEWRRERDLLGEVLRRHHADQADRMETDQLLAQLECVTPAVTYRARVVAWVYIYELVDRHAEAGAAVIQWRDHGEDYNLGPGQQVIKALTGKDVAAELKPSDRPRRSAAAGWTLGGLLLLAITVTTTLTLMNAL